MAVALRAAGSRGTTTCGIPSGTDAGDTVAIVVSGNCTTSNAVPACAGFTLEDIIRVSGTTGRYIAVLVKKAVGAESGVLVHWRRHHRRHYDSDRQRLVDRLTSCHPLRVGRDRLRPVGCGHIGWYEHRHHAWWVD